MIHNSANSLVSMKRIDLKTWLLRDEVESVIRQKLFPQGEKLKVVEGGKGEPEAEEKQKEDAQEETQGEAKVFTLEDFNAEQATDKYSAVDSLPKDKLNHAVAILAEIGTQEINFFSQAFFMHGQSIVIEFQVPNKFTVSAEVTRCDRYNLKRRIISDNNLPYRVSAQFSFLKDEEEEHIKTFVAAITPLEVVEEQQEEEVEAKAAAPDESKEDNKEETKGEAQEEAKEEA